MAQVNLVASRFACPSIWFTFSPSLYLQYSFAHKHKLILQTHAHRTHAFDNSTEVQVKKGLLCSNWTPTNEKTLKPHRNTASSLSSSSFYFFRSFLVNGIVGFSSIQTLTQPYQMCVQPCSFTYWILLCIAQVQPNTYKITTTHFTYRVLVPTTYIEAVSSYLNKTPYSYSCIRVKVNVTTKRRKREFCKRQICIG